MEVNQKQLRDAIASRTLTWLTGSSSNNDYVSVGRMANYFGFVALRVSSGQSVSRSTVAKQTLAVLNSKQQRQLIALLDLQLAPHKQTQQSRFEMNRALEGILIGEELSRDEFLVLGGAYGAAEAELGRVIAQVLGIVSQTLTEKQRAKLTAIREAHVAGEGERIKVRGQRLKLPREQKKELVNVAARLLSWTTGTEEHNDFEVVGKPSQHFGFVSLRMASNHGVRRGAVAQEVWALLTDTQQQSLATAASQNAEEFEQFLAARAKLMRVLETARSGKTIDAKAVQRLGAAVGVVEASMTWTQAMAMLEVRNTLSDAQSEALLQLRQKYTPNAKEELPSDPLDRGRQLFAQCVLCHDNNAQLAVGPGLAGIVGRDIASDENFPRYSSALREFARAQGQWNASRLDRFLQSPKTLVPGTYMGFDGLSSKRDRTALIEFLKSRP